MKIFNVILFLALLVLSFSNCSKREYTEEGIREISAQIDSLLHNVTAEEFDWGSADAFSYYTAYFSGKELVFLNEKLKYRDGGDSFNRYYIYNNNAIQYIEKKLKYYKDEAGKDHKAVVSITALITPSGDILMYDKIENGQREKLTGDESEWIYNHSKELIDIVLNRSKILKE